MFEEEQRLGKGFTISDERELDQMLLGASKKIGPKNFDLFKICEI